MFVRGSLWDLLRKQPPYLDIDNALESLYNEDVFMYLLHTKNMAKL